MVKYNVAVIRGDGVGVEVVEEGLKVLHAVGREHDIAWDATELPWGSELLLRERPHDAVGRAGPPGRLRRHLPGGSGPP